MSELVSGVNENIQVKNGQEKYDLKLGIREWKRYPEYKNSGVEWIGEIPKGWKVKRLKHNSYMKGRIGWQNLRSDEFTDEGPYLITGMHFSDGSVDWDSCYHITKERYEMAPEIQVKEHDVLITKDGSIGKLAYIDYLPGEASLNSHLLVIRPLGMSYQPRFLYYLLGSNVFEIYIYKNQTGTTFFGITQESVANFSMVVPSLSEQQTIVSFLDHETSKIDTLIEKKQRLIELLEEKRSAMISHAVTKGLDPDVKMKNSGVEWIGEVPENWETRRLKYLTKLIIDGTHFTPIYIDEGIPFLRVTDIQSKEINLELVKRISRKEHLELTKRCKPERGDLLLSKNGTIGVPCVITWDWEFSIFVSLCLIKFEPEMDVNYSKYFFLSNQIEEQITMGGKKNTITNLHLDKIKEFTFIVPSFSEQQSISNFLDRETEKIDTFINKISAQIEKLKEYRTVLISAAVTGKIDVREEVA